MTYNYISIVIDKNVVKRILSVQNFKILYIITLIIFNIGPNCVESFNIASNASFINSSLTIVICAKDIFSKLMLDNFLNYIIF